MNYFIYGTIAANLKTNPFYRGFKLLEEQAWVSGILVDTGLGFPALIAGNEIVYGKLVELDEDQMHSVTEMVKQFDELNPPFQFKLRSVTAYSSQQQYEAVTFMYEDGDYLTPIKSGKWT